MVRCSSHNKSTYFITTIRITLYSLTNYHKILIYPSKNGFQIILLSLINIIPGACLALRLTTYYCLLTTYYILHTTYSLPITSPGNNFGSKKGLANEFTCPASNEIISNDMLRILKISGINFIFFTARC